MIASWWLLFRSSSLRWTIPLGTCVCMLAVSSNLRGRPSTSMEASSEAALTILVWAPMVLLAVYASVRSSGLGRTDDVLVLPMSRASTLRRSLSVIGTHIVWVTLGWLGFWAGCGFLAGRDITPLYWSMALNGIAMASLTSSVGAALAVYRRPAWLAALSAFAAYVGLAIWYYLPEIPGSVLYSAYGPLFLVEAIPNPAFLGLQLVWSVAAVAVFTAWAARLAGSPRALVALAISAALVTAASSDVSEVRSRSGVVPLVCELRGRVQVCLWADHETTRPRISAEIDLAAALLGPDLKALYISESDLEGRPETLPYWASVKNTILIPNSADPLPREAAARIVSASLRPPSSCPTLTAGAEFGPPVHQALEQLVIDRRTDPGSPVLSDDQLAGRIVAMGKDIAQCRRPDLR